MNSITLGRLLPVVLYFETSNLQTKEQATSHHDPSSFTPKSTQ